MPGDVRYCTRCGFFGRHWIGHQISSSQWMIFAVLLLLGVIPGLLFAFWLAVSGGSGRYYICPKCRAGSASVPADSPIALARPMPIQRFCTNCGGELAMGVAHVCRALA